MVVTGGFVFFVFFCGGFWMILDGSCVDSGGFFCGSSGSRWF